VITGENMIRSQVSCAGRWALIEHAELVAWTGAMTRCRTVQVDPPRSKHSRACGGRNGVMESCAAHTHARIGRKAHHIRGSEVWCVQVHSSLYCGYE
jgi:hypothetical protein